MSETQQQPTPDTDAKWHAGHFVSETMPREFASRLERERDEAAKQIEAMCEAIKWAHKVLQSVPAEHDPRFFRAGKWTETALAKLQPFLP